MTYQVNQKYPAFSTACLGTNSDSNFSAACYDIPIADITIQAKNFQVRKREVSTSYKNDLKEDIRAIGLLEPIIVSADKNSTILLQSGHHRLAAYKSLGSGWENIPSYIVDFDSDYHRLEFLQNQNNHRPALPHSKEDAIEYLHALKRTGVFNHLPEEERKLQATEHLRRHYPQFSHGKTINAIYTRWLNSMGEGKLREWDAAKRTAIAAKYNFNDVRAMDYCLENDCFYVNSDAGNVMKNIGVLNMFHVAPKEAKEPKIFAFVNVKGKTREDTKDKRRDFIDSMKLANSRNPEFPIKKIIFLPDLMDDLDEEIINL